MQVEVRVFATLRQYIPDLPIGAARPVEVEPGMSLADVMRLVGLPAEEVKLVMRNNRQAELDDAVADGDRIAFIPPVGGG